MRKKKQTEKTKKNTKTKKTRRSRQQYPGLSKKYTSRIRREYLDQDYINQLSPDEKQWLSNFNEEWLNASFSHEGEILHKTKEEKREIYNRNNSRNRDLISQMTAQNKLVNTEKTHEMLENEELNKNVNPDAVEDAIIAIIDKKRS